MSIAHANRPRTSAFVGVSLDGFLARPDGSVDWLQPFEGEDHGYKDFMANVDGIVMGRATYDFVGSMLAKGMAWPYEGKTCVVMTHRPLKARRGERAFAGEPDELLDQMAALGLKHLYIDGGAVIRAFLAAGLLDTITISVVPLLIGSGLPLFGNVKVEKGLVLEGVRTFRDGIAQLQYRAQPG
jgi:dihydrofolate reductase